MTDPNLEILDKIKSGELSIYDITDCVGCKQLKLKTEFYIFKTGKNRGTIRKPCKDCMNRNATKWHYENQERSTNNRVRYRNKNPDYMWEYDLKIDYNITKEEYFILLEAQQGVCKICASPPRDKRLSVDHCHQTNKIRGLLCQYCNLIIGFIEKISTSWLDQSILLEEILSYLYEHKLSLASEDVSEFFDRFTSTN